MEYHKTHDMPYVKRIFGHKSILNTDLCVHLDESFFDSAEGRVLGQGCGEARRNQRPA